MAVVNAYTDYLKNNTTGPGGVKTVRNAQTGTAAVGTGGSGTRPYTGTSGSGTVGSSFGGTRTAGSSFGGGASVSPIRSNTTQISGQGVVNNYGSGYSQGSMYSYKDFLDAMNASGLAGSFSQEDLALAEKYPEFGMGILTQKRRYNSAATDEERLAANAAANQLRSSYGNYTGGGNGVDFTPGGKLQGQADNLLDSLYNYGPFEYDPYNSQYEQTYKGILDRLLNREAFSYDKDTDPNWAAYAKQYRREGQRASADALAAMSAQSGGRASTAAMTAASQAGDYYAGQLADKLPELYQQAYQRYLNEYSMLRDDLNSVTALDQMDYQKYLDDLGFRYGMYGDNYNRLQSTLGAIQGQIQMDADEAQRALENQRYDTEYADKMAQQAWENDFATQQFDFTKGQQAWQNNYDETGRAHDWGQEDKAAAYNWLLELIQAGKMPSADTLAAAGISEAEARTLAAFYASQYAPATVSYSSGGKKATSSTSKTSTAKKATSSSTLGKAPNTSGPLKKTDPSNPKLFGDLPLGVQMGVLSANAKNPGLLAGGTSNLGDNLYNAYKKGTLTDTELDAYMRSLGY